MDFLIWLALLDGKQTRKQTRKQAMKDKFTVAVWNYKGGVGKSTISLILAEIAAQRGLRVLAVDLDAQRTFAHTLSLSAESFPHISVRHTLPDSTCTADFDTVIIDTHQSTDKPIIDALVFADVVLIPIFPDYNSLINLRSAWDFVRSIKSDSACTALVKNCITGTKLASDIEQTLDTQGYPIAGRLPRSNVIMKNIALGLQWDKALRDTQKTKFLNLYNTIVRLHHA